MSSPSSQPPQPSWRSTAGLNPTKSTAAVSPGPTTSIDWRSSKPSASVSAAPSSDWRNHSMMNRMNIDQPPQPTAREQTRLQSTIPAPLLPNTLPVATVWPLLTEGDASTKNATSSISGNKTDNSATKAPVVGGAWAARGSKS